MSVGRSWGSGPVRDSQVSAEYAATCWPWTIAHPAVTGSSVAAISPGTGVPQIGEPEPTSAATETAAATTSQASWRRT